MKLYRNIIFPHFSFEERNIKTKQQKKKPKQKQSKTKQNTPHKTKQYSSV